MMKSFSVVFLVMLFSSFTLVSAEMHTVSIKGEPRTPDNKIDLMYDAGVYGGQGKMTADVEIDNENGIFEIRDYAFDDKISVNETYLVNSVNVGAMGSCFYHSYDIKWQNNQYEVFDAYAPENGPVITTKENIIDLGVLKEDKSNQIMVDSDVGLSFQAFDMDGKEVALTGGYRKFVGMSNSFKSNSQYKIVVKDEEGNTWEQIVTTGNYCESTRIIKRRDLLIVENFPNNSFPPISFSRKISLFFKSIFG